MQEEMRILVVDDDAEMAAHASRELRDAAVDRPGFPPVKIVELHDFDEALKALEQIRYDLVVLDVRKQAGPSTKEDLRAGVTVYDEIRRRRFLPVVFFTALPHLVEHLRQTPLIDVIAKDETELLPEKVHAALASGVPTITCAIEDHVNGIVRDYLWRQVAPHWEEYTQGDPGEVAYLLTARLARSLRDSGPGTLRAALDRAGVPAARTDSHEAGNGDAAADIPVWHPGRTYIYPPLEERSGSGDVIRDTSEDSWWVVLSPACDLAHGADYALLAAAERLTDNPRYRKWADSPSRNTENSLKDLLSGKKDRYYFLPAFQAVPDLIVDLQHTQSIPIERLAAYQVVASLDSPFAEALLARHSYYRGRIGTPDTDCDAVIERLRLGPQARASPPETRVPPQRDTPAAGPVQAG